MTSSALTADPYGLEGRGGGTGGEKGVSVCACGWVCVRVWMRREWVCVCTCLLACVCVSKGVCDVCVGIWVLLPYGESVLFVIASNSSVKCHVSY